MTIGMENGRRVRNNRKWLRTRAKGKKTDMKMLVEAEDRRKKWEDTSITGEKKEKTDQYKVGEV